ncbi:hypothetical protein DYBT9275_00480 [Dyadobacter sp. CECT 9275]|uniref:DUF1772 domain-containing protein n=2 Tax=Dyadobacter helix TaxID=2822344 RepID=A0A916J8N5_9BACT|nr:hypothetical protein DYBT9275_00480 [Dyadobacter sp. CECT 9275]
MKAMDMLVYVRLLGLFVYFIIASQGAFYLLLGFAKAMSNVSSDTFLEVRSATDLVIGGRLRIFYISALLLLLLWIGMSFAGGSYHCCYFVILAFLLLAADITLALRVSIPINKLLNNDMLTGSGGITGLQEKWLFYILIRGALCITGFILLLLDTVRSPSVIAD